MRRAWMIAVGAVVLAGSAFAADKLWMIWPESRADTARGKTFGDPTAGWSAARVVEDKVEIRKTASAATQESIPKPVAPGARLGNIEIPAEDAGQIVSPK